MEVTDEERPLIHHLSPQVILLFVFLKTHSMLPSDYTKCFHGEAHYCAKSATANFSMAILTLCTTDDSG